MEMFPNKPREIHGNYNRTKGEMNTYVLYMGFGINAYLYTCSLGKSVRLSPYYMAMVSDKARGVIICVIRSVRKEGSSYA